MSVIIRVICVVATANSAVNIHASPRLLFPRRTFRIYYDARLDFGPAGRRAGTRGRVRRRTARVVARRGGRPVFNSWSLLPMLPPPDWCALDELCECLYTGSPCMRCEYLDRSCGGRHTLYLDRADSQLDGHMSVLYAGRQLFVFALMRSLHAPLNVYIKSHFTKFYANTWLTHYRFTWVIQKFVKHCTLKSYLIMPLRRIPAYWYCIFLTNGIHKCAPYNRL